MHIVITKDNRIAYNQLVRAIAQSHSQEFGIDNEESRQSQAQWCKRLRSEFPIQEVVHG